jgi:phosphatidylinositol glycan class B
LASFFQPLFTSSDPATASSLRTTKRILLFVLISLNASIAFYTSQIHNSGIIALTTHLRHTFEETYLTQYHHHHHHQPARNMTLAFLMPCHSTPWRSHLQYPPTSSSPGIKAWALTCEPPLNKTAEEKKLYVDEADHFYADPMIWIKRHMRRDPPPGLLPSSTQKTGVFVEDFRQKRRLWPSPVSTNQNLGDGEFDFDFEFEIDFDLDRSSMDPSQSQPPKRRPWPEYLVFFAQLEPTMQSLLRGSAYGECARFFNSHWHDDWRRTGDVVVWCVDGEEQEKWREQKAVGRLIQKTAGGSREEILDDSEGGSDGGVVGQKILGGRDSSTNRDDKEPRKKNSESVTRVVEKPFWKVRTPEDE